MKGGAIEERRPPCKSRTREPRRAFNNFDSREIRVQIDIMGIAADLNNVSHCFIQQFYYKKNICIWRRTFANVASWWSLIDRNEIDGTDINTFKNFCKTNISSKGNI